VTALSGRKSDARGESPRLRSGIEWLMVTSTGLLVFIGLTNKWVSFNEAIRQFGATDDINYRAMASAAPGLLHRRIVEWHAERFAVQWVVGSVAKLFSLSLFATYHIGVVLVLLAVCFALAETLLRIGLSPEAATVCIAVFALNPYGVRPYLIGSGGIADLVFVLGSAIAVRGLILRSPESLLGGLLVATIARQTAVPAALVAAVVVLVDPAWRVRLPRHRVVFAAAVIVLPLACYAVIRIVAHPFAGPSPSLHTMTLLGSSRTPSVLIQHFSRCANGLLSIAGLLAGLWWVRRTDQKQGGGRWTPAAPEASAAIYGCLAFGAAIALQPALLNPKWASYNENRLAVLGLVPFIAVAGLLFRDIECNRERPIQWRTVAILVGLLALASFHHIYTVVGTASKGQTLVLEALVALALAFIVAHAGRRATSARTV
jgi:hypothetical protein